MYLIKAPYIVLTPCKNSQSKAWPKNDSGTATGCIEREAWSSTLAAAGVACTDAGLACSLAAAYVACTDATLAAAGVACCRTRT